MNFTRFAMQFRAYLRFSGLARRERGGSAALCRWRCFVQMAVAARHRARSGFEWSFAVFGREGSRVRTSTHCSEVRASFRGISNQDCDLQSSGVSGAVGSSGGLGLTSKSIHPGGEAPKECRLTQCWEVSSAIFQVLPGSGRAPPGIHRGLQTQIWPRNPPK